MSEKFAAEDSQGAAMLGFFGFVLMALMLAYMANEGASTEYAPQEENRFVAHTPYPVRAELDEESMLFVILPVEAGPSLSGFSSRDHLLRASDFDSVVSVDDALQPERCDVRLRIPVATVRVDESEDRRALGLQGTIPRWERQSILSDLRGGPGRLASQDFPYVVVRTTNCQRVSGELYRATVEVRIRDAVAHYDTELSLRIEEDGRFFARTRFDGNRADFGIEPYATFFGTFLASEKLTFGLDASGSLKSP